jgi:hypothetical protein
MCCIVLFCFLVTHWFLYNSIISFGSTHYFPLGRLGWALVDPIVTPLACLAIIMRDRNFFNHFAKLYDCFKIYQI